MKNKNNVAAELALYSKTGKLSSPKIACTKCESLVTAFGTNLEGKIKKAGGLSNLLETFTCRKCTSASKPAKPIKEKKVKKVKLHKKINEEGEVVYDIPKMKFSTPRNIFLKDAPDLIIDLTKFSCAAPQLFLDNGRACHGCAYWNNCQCPIKTANEFATA
jgi:hypothetical protein